jgi:transcriptional regulator with XRE-family HTH domain
MPRIAERIDPGVAHVAQHARRQIRSLNISQSEYAKRAGVPQYQLNRILNGRTKTVTRDVEKLCSYANISLNEITPPPFEHPRLKRAIERVWDGRPQTIEVIARLIECAGPLLAALAHKSAILEGNES